MCPRRKQPIVAPGVTGAAVRTSTLIEAGVPHWKLFRGSAPRVLHGLVPHPDRDPESFETRVSAVKLLMRPGRFFSRCTAARLWDLPLPSGEIGAGSRTIEVGAVRPVKPPKRRGVSGHQVRAGALGSIPAAPSWIPDPADVWALLGATESLDHLVAVGDMLISGKDRDTPALCVLSELEDAVRRFRGCAGVENLRRAVTLLRTGVESPSESQVRLIIVRSGLPEPQTQCPVPMPDGSIWHADLGYAGWKIAIEYEGAYHFECGTEQGRYDTSRREAMREAGWEVLTLTAHDLRDPRDFLRRLRKAIARACA